MNVVFDLDGTLIFHGQPMQDAVSDALLKIEQQGATVLFATARPLRDTLPVIEKQFWDHQIIGCNGAMISKNKQVTDALHFVKDEIVEVLDWLDKENIAYLFDGLEEYAISTTSHHFHLDVKKLGREPVCNQSARHQPIVKLLVLEEHRHEEVKAFLSTVLSDYDVYHHNGYHSFDVVPKNSNKLNALLRIGLDMNNTICMGNDQNDIAMLEAAKKAYVVGDLITLNRDFTQLNQDTLLTHLDEIAKLVNLPT
ncbi:Cof-type HAD-IIB family hydrolase [Pseudoalteromonas luteoviolacea]|uniref:HAD-IIB family hydrolase n=1 Tax=Pseudoalteromonas luteoviolacea TaxID=43657 RepID=UPI001F226DFA|nr:HAD-IIB family hydrolase [Pseudoalteromonas luteoviolacea]MCF6439271.1 Cof-type HAD-IIB family hydrolase [Pseudoalteromonas luteoviolacea]